MLPFVENPLAVKTQGQESMKRSAGSWSEPGPVPPPRTHFQEACREATPWPIWVLRPPDVQAPGLWASGGGWGRVFDFRTEQIFSILCLLLKSCPYS